MIETLTTLTRLHDLRYYYFDKKGDLVKAMSTCRRALDLISEDHPNHNFLTSHLGATYCKWYSKTSRRSDLEKGVALTKKAFDRVFSSAEAQIEQSDYQLQLNYGDALLCHYTVTRDIETFQTAVSLLIHLDGIPGGDPSSERIRRRLLFYLKGRLEEFKATGDPTILDDAIGLLRLSVSSLLGDEHAETRALLSAELGNLLAMLFTERGRIEDLEESLVLLTYARRMLEEDVNYMPHFLCKLGMAYQRRFERLRERSDLDLAIEALERSIELTADDKPDDLAARRNMLGICLQILSEATGDIETTRRAITHHEAAVELSEESEPALPIRLGELANAFLSVAQRTESIEDIQSAIAHGERALDLTPRFHSNLPTFLYNVAGFYITHARLAEDPTSLDKAIDLLRRSLASTTPMHAKYSMRMLALGDALRERYTRDTTRQEDLLEAIASYKASATAIAGTPSHRLSATEGWISAGETLKDIDVILDAFDATVRLISVVGGLEQTVQHRHANLLGVSKIPLAAAAAALEAERVDKALEWLEEGRCLVWRQLSNLRAPVDRLRAHDEALADKVGAISQGLEAGGVRLKENMTNSEALEMARLAREWDEVLATVRSLEGFEDFLQPPSVERLLKDLPETGQVVVINVHEKRCDAIALVRGRAPILIPLPLMSLEKAETQRHVLQSKIEALTGPYVLHARTVEGITTKVDIPRASSPEAEQIHIVPDATESRRSSTQGEDLKTKTARALKLYQAKRKSTHPVDEVIEDVLAEPWSAVVLPILDALNLSVRWLFVYFIDPR